MARDLRNSRSDFTKRRRRGMNLVLPTPSPEGPAPDRPAAHVHGFIELRAVSLVYGEGADQTLAVDRLDMSIGRGECVAIVGPSGCGKSTLMKLISGLTPATTGLIFVRGERVD
ncbi:MAG: nitrate transporter ATP-binding protein, partial [Hyphomicrobiales bacterium]|nr:nitrate transporter ATP-binding protein [Hyphomicrobiales bacterium]